MSDWRTIERQTLLSVAGGKFLEVESHTIQLPNGTLIQDWPWLVMPDYVIVVAVTTEDQFLCLRQTKYAVDGETLAVVGGYVERGEDPAAAAKRELLEETGYESQTWTHMGSFCSDGNRGAGTAHLYMARDAIWRQAIDADDLEEQELVLLDRPLVKQSLLEGEFKVLAWSAAISLALNQ